MKTLVKKMSLLLFLVSQLAYGQSDSESADSSSEVCLDHQSSVSSMVSETLSNVVGDLITDAASKYFAENCEEMVTASQLTDATRRYYCTHIIEEGVNDNDSDNPVFREKGNIFAYAIENAATIDDYAEKLKRENPESPLNKVKDLAQCMYDCAAAAKDSKELQKEANDFAKSICNDPAKKKEAIKSFKETFPLYSGQTHGYHYLGNYIADVMLGVSYCSENELVDSVAMCQLAGVSSCQEEDKKKEGEEKSFSDIVIEAGSDELGDEFGIMLPEFSVEPKSSESINQ